MEEKRNNHKQLTLSVRQLSKKFSKDIKYNMYYGILDLINDSLGIQSKKNKLRKKEFWALNDINFDLYEGEIIGFVGRNGSGKTTLMRVLSKVYPLDDGQIYGVPQHKITAIFALRSGMQSYFTGRENIYIKGSMYGMTRAEIDAQMSFIEDFSELGERLDRPFGNYSSGMRARLAYSIALATEPDIFIIDEALAVGDSAFKAKCIDHLKEFVQQPGKSVLFVSNHIRKVLKVATKVIVMDEGKMIYESEDTKKALNFYISNCFKDERDERREVNLKKIQEYDM